MKKNKSVIINFFLHLHPKRISESSARFTYTFGLGGLVLFAFIITAVTGVLLVFKYSPSTDSANQSLQYIATVSEYGWYIRNLHYWAAQIMVVAALLHMVRIVLTGGYLRGRAFNWIIGIILLIFIILMDFTGYPLRWDVKSNYALITALNLINDIPVLGHFLCGLFFGGPDISENTLLHLYGWHIAGLPFFFFLFMVYHFYRIRKDGGISEYERGSIKKTVSGEALLKKEIVFILFALSGLIIISAVYTPELGLSAQNDFNESSVNSPWIVLWLQFLLRYLQPFSGGIVIPAIAILYWISLPLIDKNDQVQGVWFSRERIKFWLPFILSILIISMLSIAETLIK